MNFEHVSAYGLGELLKNKNNPRGIEIGCLTGDTTLFLLKTKEDLIITSVDPYIQYIDWNGYSISFNLNQKQMVIERMKEFGSRFNLINKTSDDACVDFVNDEYDFIFIDGLHSYEQVLKDCKNYYSKIKTGGIFSGHDYNTIEGVNRAVNEFAFSVGKTIKQTKNDVWYWIK